MKLKLIFPVSLLLIVVLGCHSKSETSEPKSWAWTPPAEGYGYENDDWSSSGYGYPGPVAPGTPPTDWSGSVDTPGATPAAPQGNQLSRINNRQTLSVSLDVGQVELTIADIATDYQVTWTKGATCDHIAVTETSGGLSIVHPDDADGQCGGSLVRLTLRASLGSLNVSVGAGSLAVKNTPALLGRVKSIAAEVITGTLSSVSNQIAIGSTGFIGYSARYTGPNSAGPSLDLRLSSGTLSFD